MSREGGSILTLLIFLAFRILRAGANYCHRFRQSDQRQESLNNLTHLVCTAIKEVTHNGVVGRPVSEEAPEKTVK